MNVVPRSTGNTNSGTRELTLKCKFKCYINPRITHWALALVKGYREPDEAKKKSLTSVGIEPTTSGLDLPLLCRLSYKVA